MTININEEGPWLNVSRERIRRLFEEYMRTSAYPEHFKGVARGVQPPPNRSFWTIRKHISVDPVERGRTFVPCNLCGYEKFKGEGRLILDEMGWLYIIGPICGEKYYGERLRDDDAQYEHELQELKAFDQLVNNVDRILEFYRIAEELRPFVEVAHQAHRSILKTRKAFNEFRTAHTQQDDWLQVDEKDYVLHTSGEFKRRGYRVDVARLRGTSILKPKCSLSDNLSTITEVLGRFGANSSTSDAYIVKSYNDGQLVDLAEDVRNAVALLDYVLSQVLAFQAFFSEENFRAIHAWASDHRCPIEMKVECWGNNRVLAVEGARHRLSLDVSALMRPLPELARSIHLEEVA